MEIITESDFTMLQVRVILSLVSLSMAGATCKYNGKAYKRGGNCYRCYCMGKDTICAETTCKRYPYAKWIEGDICNFEGYILKDGDILTDNCYVCTCAGFSAYFCDEMRCHNSRSNEVIQYDENQCISDRKVYKKGEKFMRNCNKCICLEKGAIYCDITKCYPIPDTMRLTIAGSCVYKGKLYAKYQKFLDYCNVCRCRGRDKVSCKEMWCKYKFISPNNITDDCFYEGHRFPRGKTFDYGCSECYCPPIGEVKCINRPCHMILRKVDSCDHDGFYYPRDISFIKSKCRECVCMGNDRFTCRNALCEPWYELTRVNVSERFNLWRKVDTWWTQK